MKGFMTKCAVSLPLALCFPALCAAQAPSRCTNDILRGQYIFTASGFTRAPAAVPGSPWFPKAIVEILNFDGQGGVTTPSVTIANPFGDTGIIASAVGNNAEYSINDDCSGTLRFFGATNTTFRIHVAPPRGDDVWMIQTVPSNNVFQGSGKRLW